MGNNHGAGSGHQRTMIRGVVFSPLVMKGIEEAKSFFRNVSSSPAELPCKDDIRQTKDQEKVVARTLDMEFEEGLGSHTNSLRSLSTVLIDVTLELEEKKAQSYVQEGEVAAGSCSHDHCQAVVAEVPRGGMEMEEGGTGIVQLQGAGGASHAGVRELGGSSPTGEQTRAGVRVAAHSSVIVREKISDTSSRHEYKTTTASSWSSKDEVIAYGGIPNVDQTELRSSSRIRNQPNSDDTPMERAMQLAQSRQPSSRPGYSHDGALGTVVGIPVTAGTPRCHVFWMRTAIDGRSGVL